VARQRPADQGGGVTMPAKTRLDESLTPTSGVYFNAERVVVSKQSAYQLIEIVETQDLGLLMRIDGANMTSERDEFFYHENLIHPAAITHPNPRDVLIIGGGDGGAAEEVLKHPSVARCVLAELDGDVIALAKAHLATIHRHAFDDPRLHVRVGDGMEYVQHTVQQTADRFDLIYLDLTDPRGDAAQLYTPDFYRDCKRILREGGALVLHIGSPFSHRERVMASNANIHAVFQVCAPYFVHIPIYGATWGFMVASDTLDPRRVSASEIEQRLQTRNIAHRQYYNGDTHHAMLALPEYVKTMFD
jgi:spermidine synthase